jgi:hypothetical protein
MAVLGEAACRSADVASATACYRLVGPAICLCGSRINRAQGGDTCVQREACANGGGCTEGWMTTPLAFERPGRTWAPRVLRQSRRRMCRDEPRKSRRGTSDRRRDAQRAARGARGRERPRHRSLGRPWACRRHSAGRRRRGSQPTRFDCAGRAPPASAGETDRRPRTWLKRPRRSVVCAGLGGCAAPEVPAQLAAMIARLREAAASALAKAELAGRQRA